MAEEEKKEPERVTDAMLNEAALAIEPKALEEEAKAEASPPPSPQEEPEPSPPPTPQEKVEAESEVKEQEPSPEKAKEPEGEEVEEEPTDHAERSRLGRKLAESTKRQERLEAQVTELMGALRNLTGQLQQARQPAQAPATPPEEEYSPDTIIATVADLEKYAATKQAKLQKASAEYQVKYASAYLSQLQNLGREAGLDEDTYKEVFALTTNDDMKNPYNKTRSNRRNPGGDATANFYGALAGMRAKELAALKAAKEGPGDKEIPLKQDKAKGTMGVTQPTKVETKKPREVVLDDAAKEFLAYTRGSGKGMSDESVQQTLNSPLPSYLGGR